MSTRTQLGSAVRSAPTSCLRERGGEVVDLPSHRWVEPISAAERRLLEFVEGPVIDIGCGPGRHVLALAESGIVCLGIDVSLPALVRARTRGAPVIQRSVFDRVPGAGRWGTALLLDGNVGIGGEPATLLRRVARLLRADGRALIELDPPGAVRGPHEVRFELDGRAGPWFAWAYARVDDVEDLARESGLRVARVWEDSSRWFAQLDR